jgi:diacylglycerol kinase (ATP)
VPVVLVPAGTGNDLARALGLPRGDAADAAELALTGSPRAIDVGEVRTEAGTRKFLTIAALGFDANISDRTNRLRWPHGAPRYYLALLIELVRLRPMDFLLAVDGGDPTRSSGTLIAAGSTSSYGGGMPICAGAVPDDGLLDVVHVAPLGRLRLLRLFPLLLRGTHLSRPEVMHRRAQSLTVSAPGLVVYADGERIGEDACTISVLPAALTMMVPGESDD